MMLYITRVDVPRPRWSRRTARRPPATCATAAETAPLCLGDSKNIVRG